MTNTELNDFVVSSRVRFARNIKGLPYPSKLKDDRATDLAKSIQSIFSSEKYTLLQMSELDEISAGCLKERRLISTALIENSDFGSVVLSSDQNVSIMICEEDCIRQQAIAKGFKLYETYEILDKVDNKIGNIVPYSFDSQLGFLTACPTNLGTGMRASAMMFLPALTMRNEIQKHIADVGRVGITVRGVYGEGSTQEGYLYQVSNQKSLGLSETEILKIVSTAVNHLAELEQRTRADMMNRHSAALKDKIMRAYGVLTNSFTMESREFMEQIALLKLGGYFQLFNDFDSAKLETLIIEAQPYSLQKIANRQLDQQERDIFRSEHIRNQLLKLNIR